MAERRDSFRDTIEHRRMVQRLGRVFSRELVRRLRQHDESKLKEPEKSAFDEHTAALAETTYDSEEYHAALEAMRPAIEHHYAENRHHPEHFEEGVAGMNLIDLVEMFLDWAAATIRHDDGDLVESVRTNKDRFGLSDDLASILENSIELVERGLRHGRPVERPR